MNKLKSFRELVFDCPLMLIKGFVRGISYCKMPDAVYYFNKKAGIKSETMKEVMREWLGLESHVHFCAEEDFADFLKKAIEDNYNVLKIKIVSERTIKEACFNFSFSFFEERALEEVKKRLETLLKECAGCEIEIKKSEGYEPIADDFGGGLTPVVPSKKYFLSGKVCGYLPSVVKIRETLNTGNFGQISKIALVFENKN